MLVQIEMGRGGVWTQDPRVLQQRLSINLLQGGALTHVHYPRCHPGFTNLLETGTSHTFIEPEVQPARRAFALFKKFFEVRLSKKCLLPSFYTKIFHFEKKLFTGACSNLWRRTHQHTVAPKRTFLFSLLRASDYVTRLRCSVVCPTLIYPLHNVG